MPPPWPTSPCPVTASMKRGLAVDIVSVDHQTLDRDFADTPEGQWLAANSAQYGFVVRYPAESSRSPVSPMNLGIFGMWEGTPPLPCSKQNLCLEEYLIQQGYLQEESAQPEEDSGLESSLE